MEPLMNFKYLATTSAMALLASTFVPWASGQDTDTQVLRIKGSAGESGDVIQLPGSASIQVTTTSEGVTLTLPGLDVRLRCLGEATASGYCYIAAGSGGSGEDSDGDGVPDEWENNACTNTPTNALTNAEGCADVDADGYFTDQDDCPTQGGTVGADGCPADTAFTITASAGTGGSITPSGAVSVASGGTRSFTVAAENGYSVQGVSGSCGGNLAGNVYTTEAITQDCTVTATFATQTVGAGYCQGAPAGYADKLSCSSSFNLDPFEAKTSNFPGLGIPSGKVLSLPFTTGSNATTNGVVKLNSLQYVPSGYTFRAWFSTVPAGEKYENGYFCEYNGGRAFKSMGWNQGEGSGCDLAVDSTFHFNMEVFCDGSTTDCTPGTLWSGEYYLELTNQDR